MSSYSSYVLETVVTLLAVCLFAFLLLYGARRVGVGRATGALTLVGRLPIDARRSVVLVKVAEQVLVVGVSEAGLTKLGEVAAASLPPTPPAPDGGFAALLRAKSPTVGPEKKGETT